MKKLIQFIKVIYFKLKRYWLLHIQYPRQYSSGTIKSVVSNSVLHQKSLFIEENVTIKNPEIKIGKHTYIGGNTVIDSCKRIGAFCSISSDVKIGLRNHPLFYASTSPIFYSKYRNWLKESVYDEKNIKQVIIEDDVLISANVLIVNGVTVGRGAVIGAGSIVSKNVAPYAIVAGVPAKLIRYRFPEDTIELLQTSKWWKYDDLILKKHIDKIQNPIEFIKSLKAIEKI